MTVQTNKHNVVTIPFFRVGHPEYDLAAIYKAVACDSKGGAK